MNILPIINLPNGRSGHFASTAALTFIIICLARKVMKSLAAYSLCKPISHWKMKIFIDKKPSFYELKNDVPKTYRKRSDGKIRILMAVDSKY